MDEVKALVFDVFGTVVDWRTSVEAALKKAAHEKIASPSFADVPELAKEHVKQLSDDDWARFAVEWRSEYTKFTRGFVKGESEWKDVDTHHRESLIELLSEWELAGLYTPAEIESLSKTWHYLDPWPDSSAGIHKLGKYLVTATLSNGNQTLLQDLQTHGSLGFQKLFSAEDFKAYKPSPETYLGACEKLGLKPHEVAMAAAHLHDLLAASRCGLRTVYVERPAEEKWRKEEANYSQGKIWVDMWIPQEQEGLLEVARRLCK
jgi:2-haloacid dehalogenase